MMKLLMFQSAAFALLAMLLVPGGVGAKEEALLRRKLTDTNNPDTGGQCFSADATVHVRGRGNVAMRDLEVGDEVLSWQSKHYQRIYAFLHRNELAKAEYLQLETDSLSSGKPLEITRDHLLYVQGKSLPVPAGSIVVGDILQGQGGEPTRVTGVTSISRLDGVYAPATTDGTLVVDGIQVASYVALKDMQEAAYFLGADVSFLQHLGLSPFRFFCRWVSEKYAHPLNEEGLPPMVSLLNNLRSCIVQQAIPTQVALIFFYGAFAAVFWILECVLDNIAAPSFGMVLAAILVFVYALKNSNRRIKEP